MATGSTTATLSTAVRNAAAFDRAAVSPVSGLLAAVPVFTLLAALIAAGQPVAAATTSIGAMFCGIAWRVSGGRPPLTIMAVDATAMGLATVAGSVTGHLLWVHLVVLAICSLAGGMLVSVGRRAGAVGFQTILAAVVFGRFAEPVGPAFGLGGLVWAGGMAQVAFLAVVRWPLPLAVQRKATATAYRALAELALGSAQASGQPAAQALDEAEAALSGASLLGARAVMPLRSLVNEGHRIRIAIAALNGLGARLRPDGEPARALHAIASDAGWTLRVAAEAIERAGLATEEVGRLAVRTSEAIASLVRAPAPAEADAMWPVLMRRLSALGGQLRAVASLAPAAAAGSGLRGRRFRVGTVRPLVLLRGDLIDLRDSLSLRSPAARHAIRLAIIVPGAELLARALPVQRGYWVVVAAAAVLRPEFGATFTRGTERAGGTVLGVALAGIVTAALHPSQAVTIALVGIMAWLAFATFAASYAVGFSCITALVVFLLNALAPDTLQIASARMIDTLIGGGLGLLFFAAWPTWARGAAHQSLAELATALREYQAYVLGTLVRGDPLGGDARSLARASRLARARAEADVARSLSEPQTHRIDTRKGPGILVEMLRLVRAVHAVRLDAADPRDREAMPDLARLARALDVQLAAASRALASDDLQLSSEQVDLRAALQRFADHASAGEQALLPLLDELVDATNSLGDLLARQPEPRPAVTRPVSA